MQAIVDDVIWTQTSMCGVRVIPHPPNPRPSCSGIDKIFVGGEIPQARYGENIYDGLGSSCYTNCYIFMQPANYLYGHVHEMCQLCSLFTNVFISSFSFLLFFLSFLSSFFYYNNFCSEFRKMQLLIAEARIQSQTSLCGIYGVQSGSWAGISPSNQVCPCQYHSPVLHVRLFIYCGRCITSAVDSVVKSHTFMSSIRTLQQQYALCNDFRFTHSYSAHTEGAIWWGGVDMLWQFVYVLQRGHPSRMRHGRVCRERMVNSFFIMYCVLLRSLALLLEGRRLRAFEKMVLRIFEASL